MKKFFIRLLVTGILAIGGVTLSFLCLEETNLSSLISYHDRPYTSYINGPLTAGDTVHGEFRAVYDNLGMVKLRIRTYNRINTTHITFTIRQKGAPVPYATNTYATDRFADGLLYPFGFPVIPDSKGRMYEFTVVSTDGAPDNAIGIVSGYHDAASQYVLGRAALVSHFTEKMINITTNPYSILYLSMFFLPALVYYFRRFGRISVLYMLLMYSYLPLTMHSNTVLFVGASVLGIALVTHAAASLIYMAALILLIQIPVLLALGNILSADRAATLIFFLTLIGGIISLVQLKKK